MEDIERLQFDYDNDEKNMKKALDDQVAQIEENTKKDIELEKSYLQNNLDIEIAKLRQEVESKVKELFDNRYKDLGPADQLPLEEPKTSVQNNERIEKELEKDRQEYEREAKERRARFDLHMKRLVDSRDQKKIEFLKKAIVPLVNSQGVRFIADESILELRYHIKITRNAIRSGSSWALYKSRFQDKNTMCRITALLKVPIEVRRDLESSCKCLRFLCEKPMNDCFIKIYDVFGTKEKIYTFMDELNPTNMHLLVYKNKTTPVEIHKWFRQICEALVFMHNTAIAHLNVKLENVIFSEQNDVRLIGLSRAFCYFNLDQEKFIKAPQLKFSTFNDHLPPEAFCDEFNPRYADIWSLGLLLYEAVLKSNPVKKEETKKEKKKAKNKVDFNNKFAFTKITNTSQRTLLESMLNLVYILRPKLEDIILSEYVRGVAEQGANAPAAN